MNNNALIFARRTALREAVKLWRFLSWAFLVQATLAGLLALAWPYTWIVAALAVCLALVSRWRWRVVRSWLEEII